MTMRVISASSMTRVVLCPASAVLPVGDEKPGDDANRGTFIHAYLRQAVPNGREHALAGLPKNAPAEWREACEKVDVERIRQILGGGVRSYEVSWEYEPETDKVDCLGCDLGRNYPMKKGHVYGTADVYAELETRVKVYDYKTGQRVEPASENWQLHTLALMAARDQKVDEVEIGIIYVWGEQIVVDSHVLTSFDLDATALEVTRTVQRVEAARAKLSIGQVPEVYPSDAACKWCDSKKFCPARGALIKKAMNGDLEIPKIQVKDLDDAQLADAYKAVVRRYKPIIEAFDDEIRAEVLKRGKPLDLGDGMLLQAQVGRETIDAEVAFAVLEDEIGTEAANKACKLSITKDSLKSVTQHDFDSILQVIRDAGGVKIGAPSVREMRKAK